MQAIWLKGHKDKEARKKEILSYKNAFDELKLILEREIKCKPSVRDYSPGWAEKQIAVNEYNSALDDLIKLITINKE